MNFSEVLKDLMIEHNTNIRKVCKEINFDYSTAYKYYKGILPKIDTAILFANYFDCSLNYLMGIDEEPKRTTFKKEYNLSLFLQRYEELLKSKNTTHYAVCKQTKLNMSSLYSWRKGTIPYLDALEIIARHFETSIDYLVGRSDIK